MSRRDEQGWPARFKEARPYLHLSTSWSFCYTFVLTPDFVQGFGFNYTRSGQLSLRDINFPLRPNGTIKVSVAVSQKELVDVARQPKTSHRHIFIFTPFTGGSPASYWCLRKGGGSGGNVAVIIRDYRDPYSCVCSN